MNSRKYVLAILILLVVLGVLFILAAPVMAARPIEVDGRLIIDSRFLPTSTLNYRPTDWVDFGPVFTPQPTPTPNYRPTDWVETPICMPDHPEYCGKDGRP